MQPELRAAVSSRGWISSLEARILEWLKKNKSTSGQDQSEGVLYYQEYFVYADLISGHNLDYSLPLRDSEYRSICLSIGERINKSPTVRQGGNTGASWLSHRWLDPNRFSREIIPRVLENLNKIGFPGVSEGESEMTAPNQTQTVPNLEPDCGSWVIVSRETGKAVFETYSRKTAERINQEKYEVLTAYQWLIRFNQTVRQEQIESSSRIAAELGRKGGQAATEAKTQASRENGKRGGRPARINSSAFD